MLFTFDLVYILGDHLGNFRKRNPIQAVVDASKAFDQANIHLVKQVLSPLLHHNIEDVATQARHAILPTESNGKWSTESRDNYCEYKRQYLGEKLLLFRIALQPCGTVDSNNLVTYRGELHGKQGIKRVTCRATAPCGPDATAFRAADETLTRIIYIMETLQEKDQTSSHFSCNLLHDQTSELKFYVSNQDWELKSLSEVLLADLRNEEQQIRLEDKMKIIKSCMSATRFANRRGVLLRSITAESFTAQETGCGIHVTFSDLDAARRTSDTGHLTFTGILTISVTQLKLTGPFS